MGDKDRTIEELKEIIAVKSGFINVLKEVVEKYEKMLGIKGE